MSSDIANPMPVEEQEHILGVILADLAGVGFIFGLSLFGSQLFQVPSIRGGQILFFAFVAMGFAINWLKRLEPISSLAEDRSRNWGPLFSTAAIPYWGGLLLIAFVLLQAVLNNIVDDFLNLYSVPGEVNEGELGIYVMFGPTFVWFIAAAIFFAGLIVPTSRVIEQNTSRYELTQFVGLFATNIVAAMFALTIWQNYLHPVLGQSPILGLVPLTLILITLFMAIRLRVEEKNNNWKLHLSYALSMFMMSLVTILIAA